MATYTVEMKKYNGSNWDSIYPKTTIAQVVNLATQLSDMESDIDDKAPKDHLHIASDITDFNSAVDAIAMTQAEGDERYRKFDYAYVVDNTSNLNWGKVAEITMPVQNIDKNITFLVTQGYSTSLKHRMGILRLSVRCDNINPLTTGNVRLQWLIKNKDVDKSAFVAIVNGMTVSLYVKPIQQYAGTTLTRLSENVTSGTELNSTSYILNKVVNSSISDLSLVGGSQIVSTVEYLDINHIPLDSTHRFITDNERTAWNNMLPLSGGTLTGLLKLKNIANDTPILQIYEDDTFKGDAFALVPRFSGSGDSNRLDLRCSDEGTGNANFDKTAFTVYANTANVDFPNQLSEAGQRVYSPNNKPTVDDVDGAQKIVTYNVTGLTKDLNADYLPSAYNDYFTQIILFSVSDGGTSNISNKPQANSFKMYRFTQRSASASDWRVRDIYYTTSAVYTRDGAYNGTTWTWQTWRRTDLVNLSELNTDSTHRLVTDTEKSTWNAKLSSITKAMVESVLTGGITTHYHYYDNLVNAPQFDVSGTTLTITL